MDTSLMLMGNALRRAVIHPIAEVAGLLSFRNARPLLSPAFERVFLSGVSDVYKRKVTLGRDGTIISIPSGAP